MREVLYLQAQFAIYRWRRRNATCTCAHLPGRRGDRINCQLLHNPDPRTCPLLPRYWGQADINSASSDRLGLLGIPVQPASLIRLARATFMILGVVLIRT